MELPLLSVIVPVYKVEKYLDKCLESLTGQTYSNLEIILVEDGSPDQSGAICDQWAARDSRIRVLHKKNAGAGPARNDGLDLAQGELIGFVDSDDYLDVHMYEHLYSLMDAGTDIVECGFLSTTGDNALFDGGSREFRCYTAEEAMEHHIQNTIFRQLIWNKLYRREAVGGVRFPVGTTIDDEYFTYQVLANARKLIHSDRVCYAYRQQGDSIMHRLRAPRKDNAIQAKQQRLEYLKVHMPRLVEDAKEDLLMNCVYAMQDCVQYLSGEELKEARAFLHQTAAQVIPLENRRGGTLRRLLLFSAQHSLEATAKLLNLLLKLHILT